MKVAIAVDKNKCSYHFGHCEGFKIYDIVDENCNLKLIVHS